MLSCLSGLVSALGAGSTEIGTINEGTSALVFTVDSGLPALIIIYSVLHHATNTDGTVNVSGLQTVRCSGGNGAIIWEGEWSGSSLFLLGLGLCLGLGRLDRFSILGNPDVMTLTGQLEELGYLFGSSIAEGGHNGVNRHSGRSGDGNSSGTSSDQSSL
jgi:hypothetical protein